MRKALIATVMVTGYSFLGIVLGYGGCVIYDTHLNKSQEKDSSKLVQRTESLSSRELVNKMFPEDYNISFNKPKTSPAKYPHPEYKCVRQEYQKKQ